MRKILIPLFLLMATTAGAQLNNSWIDYNKTYYKFKIGKTGLNRINQPALALLGLDNIPAEQFQLWRNGEQVRIYTTSTTGALGSGGYIEFLAKMNDGIPDKQLYKDPQYQLCDSFSIHSDTAAYFLTVNTAVGGNLRYSNAVNNVAGNTLAPDAYFMRRVSQPFKTQYNRGYAVVLNEYVYSSSYDLGEGWTSSDAGPCCDLFKEFEGLNVYTAGPANGLSVYVSAFGNALNIRNFRLKIYDKTVINESMNFFDTVKTKIDNLPLSYLQNPDRALIAMNGNSTNPNDRVVVAEVALTYPATFNFNNAQNFYFELQPTAVGNYLVIDNFNAGSVPPVLYSLNDGKRYTGDITVPGKVRFALPAASGIRKFNLVSEDASYVANVNKIVTRSFINYANTDNQGDYLIITSPILYNDGNGVNYVDEYRKYRASATGGGYKPIILSVDELTDQFAFGIKKHPAAIRDFVRFANSFFSQKPKYIFLMGRGMSSLEYKQNENDPLADKIDLVPSFGWPASDVLLACEPGTYVPLFPIGRIGAVSGTEIKYYLNKVKEYEQAQASPSQTVAEKEWMKNIIHVIGGADSSENKQFRGYMDNYKKIAEDSNFFGAKVQTFEKSSTSSVEQASGERIQQLISEGVSFIGYFGHSSANTLAFNLTSPELFNNKGKYTFFNVSGCSAGNFYGFEPLRFQGNQSISEKYVLADQRGSIGFLASTHLGIPPFLNFYNTELYSAISVDLYNNTIGNQIKKVMQFLGSNAASLDFYTRIHLEEINLHGDPAIKLNSFALPDYVIEEPLVKISPSVISVADNNFTLNYKILNIGKSVKDSVRLLITRILANDSVRIIYNKLVPATVNADSMIISIPINPITDKGLNKITVTIDADNKVAELSETNNTITKEFYIFEDEIRPVFPYNYSIVNNQAITFTASTANPLSGQRQYLMEIDTTSLFNSPFKKQYSNNGNGGLVQFNAANILYTDSIVYYWRTSQAPLNNEPPIWNTFSFIYLSNGGQGFNQSHYYQHLNSTLSNTITLDGDRVYRYTQLNRSLQINTGLYPATKYDRINVLLDFDQIEQYGCKYNVLQFLVYDSVTMQPWENYKVSPGIGRFGSNYNCVDPVRKMFEFSYQDAASRKRAIDFLDSIPDGMYVSITNLGTNLPPSNPYGNLAFISQWQADTATLGTGNSLYHKLKAIGFSQIDSFYKNLPFVYFYRKNHNSFTPKQVMGKDGNQQLNAKIAVPVKYKSGTIESPLFGPAKSWTSLHWRGKSVDKTLTDSVQIEVYGVKQDGTEKLMATVEPATDTSIAFINAATYPFVKLKMVNTDNTFATPNQLSYWRLNASYMPEGAVAPNILFKMKDTLEQGENIDFSLAFKNISTVAFDSLKVKFIITNRNNVAQTITLPKQKALISGDTLIVNYKIDTRNYPGLNTLNVIVNPDNDQPEQYLYNNFIFKDFYVKEDKKNPLLDVTFDGIHILNKDIVAAKPHILIKLKDESRFLGLYDTSLLKVMVIFPNGTSYNYYFGNSLVFTPANLSSKENTASIDFYPEFSEDGDYELIVTGKDAAGNKAGNLDYKIGFSIINKPMISNLLNYPNPFTTSTSFVFTITGAEVPQNLRIQILTITGKVVKEITKNELTDLHIGRNITDYKWDGTDMYGQKLGNGVYLYRVITNLNGKSLDKYKSEADNTDKFFKAGYGKMYLMR